VKYSEVNTIVKSVCCNGNEDSGGPARSGRTSMVLWQGPHVESMPALVEEVAKLSCTWSV